MVLSAERLGITFMATFFCVPLLLSAAIGELIVYSVEVVLVGHGGLHAVTTGSGQTMGMHGTGLHGTGLPGGLHYH